MYPAQSDEPPDCRAWLSDWWRGFPMCSRGVAFACLLVSALQLCRVLSPYRWCLDVSDILEGYQGYRILTGPFLHGGLLHLLFNLLAFCSLAPQIERHCGTASFAGVTATFLLTSGILAVALVGAVRFATLQMATRSEVLSPVLMPLSSLFPYNACSIGLSGLLFSYLTMQAALDGPGARRTFCGLISVPASAYPWVLLILASVLWPEVAFHGHLCGLLVGYAGCWLDRRLQRLGLDRGIPGTLRNAACYSPPGGNGPPPAPPHPAAPTLAPFRTGAPGGRPGPYGTPQAPPRPAPPPPRFPGTGRSIGTPPGTPSAV